MDRDRVADDQPVLVERQKSCSLLLFRLMGSSRSLRICCTLDGSSQESLMTRRR
jgi:hypothetical protein